MRQYIGGVTAERIILSLLSIFVRIQITLDRHSPILVPNDCSLPDPPHFSLLFTLPFNSFLFQVVITVRDIRPRLVEEADTMGIKVCTAMYYDVLRLCSRPSFLDSDSNEGVLLFSIFGLRSRWGHHVLTAAFWTMIQMGASCFRSNFMIYDPDEGVMFPSHLSGLWLRWGRPVPVPPFWSMIQMRASCSCLSFSNYDPYP